MKVARSVAEVLSRHTTLTLECVDGMYLNVYVPLLQAGAGVAHFFRKMHGRPVPSSALMAPMTQRFVEAIKRYAEHNRIDIVSFRRGERKDERTREYLRTWAGGEGVLYIGRAQEKARVLRTERRHDPATGATYPWLAASTAMVNQYYFYAVDDDFGPFFLKFCSYFPYNAKLCINGHEYLKRQLTKRGIAYESLDNGIRRCADPDTMQRLADGLTAHKVDALLRKWLARLPHPFAARDRQQGIRYDVSILQAEFALTQVFDRPAQGRVFFEQVVRENLDMGRPDHVQLIFDRRISRRTPSRYRTRVITDGVIPSLHVDYKHSHIKQYHKEGRALRTETVINDTYDFDVGRRLSNLDDLKRIGFAANRRLLGVQRLSHDCILGADVLDELHRPVCIDGQRASALRFGDRRGAERAEPLRRPAAVRPTTARFPQPGPARDGGGAQRALARRLRCRPHDLRPAPAPAAGHHRTDSPHQRYRLAAHGFCIARAYYRTQARVLGPVLSATLDGESTTRLHEAVAIYDREVDPAWHGQALAA